MKANWELTWSDPPVIMGNGRNDEGFLREKSKQKWNPIWSPPFQSWEFSQPEDFFLGQTCESRIWAARLAKGNRPGGVVGRIQASRAEEPWKVAIKSYRDGHDFAKQRRESSWGWPSFGNGPEHNKRIDEQGQSSASFDRGALLRTWRTEASSKILMWLRPDHLQEDTTCQSAFSATSFTSCDSRPWTLRSNFSSKAFPLSRCFSKRSPRATTKPGQ